jgi:hypothetical protein
MPTIQVGAVNQFPQDLKAPSSWYLLGDLRFRKRGWAKRDWLWALGESQKIIWLNPIRLSFKIFVPIVKRDDDVGSSPTTHCPERPFPGFDTLDGAIKINLPLRPVWIYSTYAADTFMWVISWLFVNAGNLYGLRH